MYYDRIYIITSRVVVYLIEYRRTYIEQAMRKNREDETEKTPDRATAMCIDRERERGSREGEKEKERE